MMLRVALAPPCLALCFLLAVPAAASGTLLDEAVVLFTFQDSTASTTVSAANDGNHLWSASGHGGFGNPITKYNLAGTALEQFDPQIDFRSLFTDQGGNLYAKEFGTNVWSITPAGTASLLFTVTDPSNESSAGFNADASEIYTLSDGRIRRHSAVDGTFLGAFPLIGFGTVGHENTVIDGAQMETTGSGQILTYTDGIVSAWDLAGNRVGMCNVRTDTPNAVWTRWSFGVDFAGNVYLMDTETLVWTVYDVGAESGPPGTALCFGDGSGAPCGCGNQAPPGAGGCLNGLGVSALLFASGVAETQDDTLELACTGVPAQTGLFFQGDQVSGAGAGVPFGDGLRCCGQNVVRLEVLVPPGPEPATATLGVTITDEVPPGSIAPGDTRCYQYWYRDPAASPCGSNFNLSNAVRITWS